MSKIGLKEMIQDLRSELMDAKHAGENEALQFLVEDFAIEVEVLASQKSRKGRQSRFLGVSG